MKNLDIPALYNLNVEMYGVALTSGSPTVLPSGPVSFRKPIGVLIVEITNQPPTQQVVAYSWSTDVNNVVTITPTLLNGGVTTGNVAVFYQK